MSQVPLSIRAVAAEVAKALSAGSETDALRLAFQFVERYDRATPENRSLMVQDVPAPTGDARFDALIGAVAEFSSAKHCQPAPSWVEDSSRFLERWWFVSGIRTLHADAIAHSPISFARRGVFVGEGALTYA